MIDIMSGPNAPLAKAFVMAQWRTAPIDRVFGANHDLADPEVQARVHGIISGADFVWAALDCSTKSRARGIPRNFADGRKMPGPLRSDAHPMGLPELQGSDKERVTRDNDAAEFVLGELRVHQERGGASGRENPESSLHWSTPTEVGMFSQGKWFDKLYDACTMQGARRKRQRLRHDLEELRQWPDMRCRHTHDLKEWTPQVAKDGGTWYPTKEEAEYTACLVFHVVRAATAWVCRVGRAKLKVPRAPPIQCVGDRKAWLQLDSRAMREWAMVPMAIAIGLDVKATMDPAAMPTLPKREIMSLSKLGAPTWGIYVGVGHHTHGQPPSKWATPFTEGQHGTHLDCMIHYVNYIHVSGLVRDIGQLAGKTLLCDCPYSKSCVADVLIAECYAAWERNTPEVPRGTPDGGRRQLSTTVQRAADRRRKVEC